MQQAIVAYFVGLRPEQRAGVGGSLPNVLSFPLHAGRTQGRVL